MAIDAGDLNLPARFYRPNRTQDVFANTVPGDGLVCQAWVSMTAIGAGEQVTADAVQMTSTFELRTRWRRELVDASGGAVPGSFKVLVGGVLYEIDGPPVDPDGRRVELKMLVHPAETRR